MFTPLVGGNVSWSQRREAIVLLFEGLVMYCQHRSNNQINRIHERALRIAYNDYTSDFESLLQKDNSVTFHERNIQDLTLEVYKTMHDLNPVFMREIFSLKQNIHHTRNEQLIYHNPRTVAYGLQYFGFKASHSWRSIPRNIQETTDINIFKNYTLENIKKFCKCNLCKTYIANVGYTT